MAAIQEIGNGAAVPSRHHLSVKPNFDGGIEIWQKTVEPDYDRKTVISQARDPITDLPIEGVVIADFTLQTRGIGREKADLRPLDTTFITLDPNSEVVSSQVSPHGGRTVEEVLADVREGVIIFDANRSARAPRSVDPNDPRYSKIVNAMRKLPLAA